MRRVVRCAAVAAAVLLLPGCSLLGDDDDGPGELVSTFTVKSGDCVVPPEDVAAELADLRVVPCDTPHTQEAYAVVAYAGGSY